MPKRKCKCGEILPLGDIPCKIQYNFISDTDYDSYSGIIDSEELYMDMKMFIKCPNCRRIWVYWEGFDHDPEEYIRAQKE